MGHVFISYGRQDDESFVQQLRRKLQAAGIDVWWDRASMESRGRSFLQELRDAIAACDRLLLVVGPEAVVSEYVESEWRAALEYCRVVVPILRLGSHDLLPPELAKLHCPDFRNRRSHRAALDELLRILRAPVPALAALHGVDELPPHFVQRPADLEQVASVVLADVRQPTVIVSVEKTAALQGMGGTGKSVLAAAFARACDTRRSFGDGIIWLRLGQNAEPLRDLSYVGRCLGDLTGATYPDLRSAVARLSTSLADKSCLIVLDDVWRLEDVVPLSSALGSRNRLVLTTRDAGIAISLGAREIGVDVLSMQDALELLARWAGVSRRDLPAIADDLARECGRLPLALAIVGSLARNDLHRWEGALERLQASQLDKIRRQFPNYPYPDVLRAIDASVEMLEPALRERYLELAIFRETDPVPESTLALYWAQAGLDLHATRDVVDLLVERSLARRTIDGRLTLHDLQFDYVRHHVGNCPELHHRLVEAYRSCCGGDWAAVTDDGYYFKMLPHHLAAAGMDMELAALLAAPAWMEAKLQATSFPDLLADYRAAAGGSAPDLIRRSLEMSTRALSRSPRQLRGQVLGRLLDVKEPAARTLATSLSRNVAGIWFRPEAGCLTPVGGPLLATLPGHSGRVNALSVSADSKVIASASSDGLVKIVALDTPGRRVVLNGHTNDVNAVALLDDGRRVVSGSGMPRPFKEFAQFDFVLARTAQRPSTDNSIRLWDVRTGEQLMLLSGHEGAVRALEPLPGSRFLASGSDDRTVRLWDLEAGKAAGILGRHDSPVVALRMMQHRDFLIAASETDFAAYDLGRPRAPGNSNFDRAWQNVLAIDGRNFVLALQYSTFDGYYYILQTWNILTSEDGKEDIADLYKFTTPINCAAFSGDGSRLLVGLSDRTCWLFDVQAREEVARFPRHAGEVTAVALSGDGRTAVSGTDDGEVRIWDTAPAKQAKVRRRHESAINSIAITVTCDRALSGSYDGTLMVWDLATGDTLLTMRGHESPVRGVALTTSDLKAVSGADDGTVRIWSLADGTELMCLGPTDGRVNAVAVRPDGSQVAALSRTRLHIWDLASGSEVTVVKTGRHEKTALAFTADGHALVIGDVMGGLTWWELGRRPRSRTLLAPTVPGKAAKAKEVYYSAIRGPVGSPAEGKSPRIIELTITPSGLVFAGLSDGRIIICDPAPGRSTRSVAAHDGAVLGIRASAQGPTVLSVGDDGYLRSWNANSLACTTEFTFDETPYCVGVGADGRTVAVGTGGGPGSVFWLHLDGPVPSTFTSPHSAAQQAAGL
jgi:WD40 repeat protein